MAFKTARSVEKFINDKYNREARCLLYGNNISIFLFYQDYILEYRYRHFYKLAICYMSDEVWDNLWMLLDNQVEPGQPDFTCKCGNNNLVDTKRSCKTQCSICNAEYWWRAFRIR